MRQQLPKEIDPFRFAQTGRELEGEIKLATLSRLSASLYKDDGVVQVSMQFAVDDTGTPYMQGHFETTLSLTCERCLQELVLPLKIDTQLGLVRHEKLAEKLSDQYEPWVIEDHELVDPATVVEDELILALPLVPKHEENCLPDEAWVSEDKADTQMEKPDKPESPFAILSELKSKK
ncbi:YceD family protein [uncultured Methylophaga sp.]|uniref:YceD family protein n=1 Tax=uncultured Methylophaga sp. TaxID=285271 RepID=UPI002615DDF8|nr:YceD family protein [uncultured Methylophaga sp.]